MKIICSCGGMPNAYRGIPAAGLTSREDYLWVHSTCRLPTRLVFEGFIRRCPGCLTEFSNPYESLCRECFREEFGSKKYRNYSWARKLIDAPPTRLPKPLPAEPHGATSRLSQAEDASHGRNGDQLSANGVRAFSEQSQFEFF